MILDYAPFVGALGSALFFGVALGMLILFLRSL
jgi:hypothetical protein